MADLKIGILGLNRIGASMGLALRRYMDNGGKHNFSIIGYDYSDANSKEAQKMGAVDSTERKPFNAVAGADLVIMNVSYDEVKDAYQLIAPDLRDGAVVLDTSPLKRPSLQWAAEFLNEEQHMIGITPILNPKYLYDPKNSIDAAAEDLFDNSTILVTPSVKAIKEAVDLAFNFSQIIGSKPRFLDPLEHDTLLAQTDGVPNLIGTALFYNLTSRANWDDVQWLTNPAFGALTRALYDQHPDALRDQWLGNADVLARSLDDVIDTLSQMRDALKTQDRATLEAALEEVSKQYEVWVNRRYRADWDQAARIGETGGQRGFMSTLLGGAIADRFSDKDKDK